MSPRYQRHVVSPTIATVASVLLTAWHSGSCWIVRGGAGAGRLGQSG